MGRTSRHLLRDVSERTSKFDLENSTTTNLHLIYHLNIRIKQKKTKSKWPRPSQDRTTMLKVRQVSTNKSTWSCMPAMSTTPWHSTLTVMMLQCQRGGRIVLQPIQKPERDEWGTGLEAMKA